ncbi:MAG: flavin reductase family protein [Sphingomonadales bacterium]|nr:flavin reductase family protein [Sphingomonadales bacterium]
MTKDSVGNFDVRSMQDSMNGLQISPDHELADHFRRAMRRLSAGVAVVCCADAQGPVGLTATSVTSLSMDPPSLLVCINRSASLRTSLAINMPFSINLLGRQHADISNAFGGAARGEDRFRFGDWETGISGVPILKDAIARIECVVDLEVEYGSHTIFVGRITRCISAITGDPLIYADGRYM